jgi:membrane protease YdiL (CAAX protease family)
VTSRLTRVAAPLDARLAEVAADPGRSWGVRDALLGLLAVPGFGPPRWSDAGLVLGWSVLLFVLQATVSSVVGLLVPALRGVPPDNTSFLVGIPVAELLLVAFAAVVVAPVVEELLFRGLLLQGLMLRIGFWPAALLSSVAFGVLHMASLDAAGAALALATGVMGLGLCVLARRTGRLGPGIAVHALRNALAIALVAVS